MNQLQKTVVSDNNLDKHTASGLGFGRIPSTGSKVRMKSKTEIFEFTKRFTRKRIVKLLSTLYDALRKEEDYLRKCDDPSNWWERLAKALYSCNGSSEYDSDREFRLVGPNGERPIHVCFLRACHFPHLAGFKEGILEGVMDFIECSEKKHKFEIDMPYGKDYCAAVGYMLHQGETEILSKTQRNKDRPVDESAYDGVPPYWHDLQQWASASESLSKRMDRSDYESQAQAEDLITLTTCGLYEGETPMLMAIADKNVDMVKWILCSYGARPSKMLSGLFFRPMRRKCIERRAAGQWKQYFTGSALGVNENAASKESYLGLNPLFFAASQGRERRTERKAEKSAAEEESEFNSEADEVEGQSPSVQILDALVQQECKFLVDLHASMCKKRILEAGRDSELKDQAVIESLCRQAILNRQDEYGNTMLHLAAWSGGKAIFKWLVDNGADNHQLNRLGMSPMSLAACFGHWDMFRFIWENYFVHSVWEYGSLRLRGEDKSHIDTTQNLNDSIFIQACVDRLRPIIEKLQEEIYEIRSESKKGIEDLRDETRIQYERDDRYIKKLLREFQERDTIDEFLVLILSNESLNPGQNDKNLAKSVLLQAGLGDSAYFLSVVEAVSICKPRGWYKAIREIMEPDMLTKWDNVYGLVHIGQCVFPNAVVYALFFLAWTSRELNIRSVEGVDFIASNADIPDASCGWHAMMKSYSGNMQLALVFYGVPSMLRSAWAQRRVFLSDLDVDGDLEFSYKEFFGFLYQNAESIFCIMISCLFIAIAAARIVATSECSAYSMHIEKNSTVIAAMFLFANLLNLIKPYKGFGTLVMSTLEILATDIVTFGMTYVSLFLAFLLSISTINLAYNRFLFELENDPGGFNSSETRKLSGSGSLDMDTTNCGSRVLGTVDTAYKLFALSLGDGLADAILSSRTIRDDACAGFTPDRLLGLLYVIWIILTNILQLNLLIAMMTRTFDRIEERIGDVWLLDICRRIDRFEKTFPQLRDRSRTPPPPFSLWSGQFWRSVASDLMVVVLSIPEVDFLRYCMFSIWGELVLAFGLDHDALHASKGVNALLNLEGHLGVKPKQDVTTNSTRKSSRTSESPRVRASFKNAKDIRLEVFWNVTLASKSSQSQRRWNKNVVECECARLFGNHRTLVDWKEMQKGNTLYLNHWSREKYLLEWRRAVLGMIRRLLAQKPSPVRVLELQK